MKYAALLALGLLLSAAAQAQDNSDNGKPIVTPPPPPDELTIQEDAQPDVQIIKRDWATIEEYSVNGQVYAVKVTPARGAPYYFYDVDGDGVLETKQEILDTPNINTWKILEW